MNKENFQKVIDEIEKNPDSFDQKNWHCGTKHCFAGHAQILGGFTINPKTTRRDARIFLDVSKNEADWLFNPSRTLDDFKNFLNGCYGYDRDGYNCYGYDRDGYNCYGYNRDGYNRDGYDHDGYNRDGYNRDGHNRDGYNRDGYDYDGLDKNNKPKE
jgi:hypothetical protein